MTKGSLSGLLIYNDGKLPETWTVDDLFAPHTSKPHNPLIAGVFFRSGQIEAWGRGIEKITSACRDWGKPEPFYRVRTNEVMIGFNTELQYGEKYGDKFGDKTGYNETQGKILAIMKENPNVSTKAIAKEIGLTLRGVEKSIRFMKKAGLIDRVGAAKGGHWEVSC
jgi:ATP-dependent DNA helicase RecG